MGFRRGLVVAPALRGLDDIDQVHLLDLDEFLRVLALDGDFVLRFLAEEAVDRQVFLIEAVAVNGDNLNSLLDARFLDSPVPGGGLLGGIEFAALRSLRDLRGDVRHRCNVLFHPLEADLFRPVERSLCLGRQAVLDLLSRLLLSSPLVADRLLLRGLLPRSRRSRPAVEVRADLLKCGAVVENVLHVGAVALAALRAPAVAETDVDGPVVREQLRRVASEHAEFLDLHKTPP
ncbi:MAG: hypothetical protein BWY06_01226 [Candidatus Latescibacteria bacterium ADurb.Bin168]|nr:MAG: hypothetical protein BWY06_01226 [Candidatus Latescibacteria bacterium ADurb.Bin168]